MWLVTVDLHLWEQSRGVEPLHTPSHPFTHFYTQSHSFTHLYIPSDMSSRIMKLKLHQPDLQWVFDPVHTVFRALCWGVAATPVEGDAPNFELWPETPSTDVEVSIHVDGHWQDTRSVKVIRELIIRDVWYHFFQCEYKSSFSSSHSRVLTLESSLSNPHSHPHSHPHSVSIIHWYRHTCGLLWMHLFLHPEVLY